MNPKMRVVPKLPKGRPQKYGHILLALEDHDLYTPALIANFAINNQWIPVEDRQRLRINMSRFGRNHNFPIKGDGFVTLPGLGPIPAYWGHRWKAFVTPLREVP